jgi:MFS family permease
LCQIPAGMITDFFGKRKSIILGNIFLIFYMLILIYLPGAISVILADFFYALGHDMKNIAESNLLYDSVSTKGGEGLYSKLDAKGGSWYYILDGVASLTAGYLFVMNNYLPMYICLGFIIISTIISFGFNDIYEVSSKDTSIMETLKGYKNDIRVSFKFMIKSKRMKSFVLFQMVFYGLIKIIDTYSSDLLTDLGVPEEQFSMIFAVLILVAGLSLSLKKTVEKKFKNRTLTFISLVYIGACIFIGTISSITTKQSIIPLILIMYALQKISTSMWYILEYKYLKNFTTEDMRNKITFSYEIIGGAFASIASVIGGLLLEVFTIENAFLIVGLASLAIMILVLDYMRKRFGLKPEEYKKEDLEFETENLVVKQ